MDLKPLPQYQSHHPLPLKSLVQNSVISPPLDGLTSSIMIRLAGLSAPARRTLTLPLPN